MTDLVERGAGGETDAWCPYCDKLRGRNRDGLKTTCGSGECFRAAMRAVQQLPLGRTVEVDFQNGFASHNLVFSRNYARRL